MYFIVWVIKDIYVHLVTILYFGLLFISLNIIFHCNYVMMETYEICFNDNISTFISEVFCCLSKMLKEYMCTIWDVTLNIVSTNES